VIEKDPQQIAAMFSSIARRYDLANHLLSFNRDKKWRKRLVAVCAPKPGDKILDVCTGTADLAIEFARSGINAEIIGLDLSKQMLDVGRNKVQRSGLQEKIKLQEGHALQLPFADESFDIVAIAFGLRNLPDLREGVTEMSRVLKESGRLAILEFSVPQNALFRRLYLFYLAKIMPLFGGAITGSRIAYEYLYASILEFPDRQGILEWMRNAGLKNLKTFTLSFGIATIYLGEKSGA